MDQLDRDLQKRVWQRVRGREQMPPLQPSVKPWLLMAQENAAAYQQLSKSHSGREGEQLRRLHQESMHAIACLKGICRLRGENLRMMPQPGASQTRKPLEQCYRRERKLWEQLGQNDQDPEFGMAFAWLAHQAQNRGVILLELLGRGE